MFIIGYVILHKIVYLGKKLWWAFGLLRVIEVSNRDRFYTENMLMYFWMKKKESCEQKESTSTNSVVIFTEYHSTWPKEQQEQQKNSVAIAISAC